MKVGILGDGLTSLALAKSLTNLDINIDIFESQRNQIYDKSRTLAISKDNTEFFNQNIINIQKLLWNIKKIEIYSENLKNEKLINFKSKNNKLFSIVRNFDLKKILISELKKNKFIRFKKNHNFNNSDKDDYKLIINCDNHNLISKKFFYKKNKKNYNSFAHTTIIKHKKLSDNHTASQIFTKYGPLAFLPISSTETSIVFSVKGKKSIDFENLIKKYNTKYTILKISNIASFELKSSDLRSYHYKNILAFGDLLHKLHPLAGQGFNMSLRDIKELLKLINFKIEHGLDLDSSICKDFEENTKHKNYLFLNGIDFVYEFFNFQSKNENTPLTKFIQMIGKNHTVNKFFTKVADKGIII